MPHPADTNVERGAAPLRVQVVYARPGSIVAIDVALPPGSTVGDAISAARLPEHAPELDGVTLDVGVFGRPRRPDDPVHDGDRVEVYRPLVVDPKEARRIRAQLRAAGKGGGGGKLRRA